MTVHAPNPAGHRAAIAALLSSLPVFEYGKVPGLEDSAGNAPPGETPTVYALLLVERIRYDNNSLSGRSSRTMWRASIRAVGRTHPDNCRIALSRIQGIENQRIVVGDLTSTPIELETSEDAQPDDGWYSALVRFKYAI